MGFSDDMKFRDCPWCGLRMGQMIVLTKDMSHTPAGKQPRTFSLLACPSCAGPLVVETNKNQQSPTREIRTFPAPDDDLTVGVSSLPDDVGRYFKDAQRVMMAGVPDAAAVQLRRTLEAAAAHFGHDDGVLMARIRKLIDEGRVTRDFGDVLHVIRKVGNIGAHHTDEVIDDETASRALEFTTQVLRNLFEIPAKLAEMSREVDADKR